VPILISGPGSVKPASIWATWVTATALSYQRNHFVRRPRKSARYDKTTVDRYIFTVSISFL
jgi:hypothetical protein